MKKLLNISNHTLGLEQIDELASKGYQVVELPTELKQKWGQLTPDNYHEVCHEIKDFMVENEVDATHVAGFAPAVNYFVNKVSVVSNNYYAYSARDLIVEVTKPDGTVVKEAKFRHKGFYLYD